jgi:nicotinate phosphoribosyltransferase
MVTAMENLTLHTDKYQINMMYAHWLNGTHNKIRVFEAFFRKNPFGGGYAVFAGLERIMQYIENLRFEESDIDYLREQEEGYDEAFLDELRNFRFTGDLYAMREGTIVFPNEPILRVEGRVFEAQLIETAILNFMNFQTLIATKAARIKHAAPNDTLMEFGTRRAQEASAALWGARAAVISGFHATSNMLAGKMFGIQTKGTHAHAFVQDAPSEYEAFEAFAKALPDHVTLLVDTYDTLKSGVPNAIKIGKMLDAQGKKLRGIRLDSGDLAYLSKEARRMLDEAGLSDVKIVASNDLDENLIESLKAQGAAIDTWGVGTKLITAEDTPSLGGVYKVVAKLEGDEWEPTIKISGNPEKITTPGRKAIYRIINRHTQKAEADYLAFTDEVIDTSERLKLFDPVHTYLHKFVTDFDAVPLQEAVIFKGKRIAPERSLPEIAAHHQQQKELFWPEYLRNKNPERYPVDMSQQVWDMKMNLIQAHTLA